MKYRLIASDMDGTLLTDDKRVTDRTLNAIKKALEKGAVFAVSSGRSIYFCDFFEKLTGLSGIPFILYNGAKIVGGPDHRVIRNLFMSQEDALWLIEEGCRIRTTVIVWADDLLYVNEINDRVRSYEKLALTSPVLITDPKETVKKGVSKILWFDTAERAPFLRELLDTCPIADHIKYYTSDPRFMEIMDVNSSKARALEALAESFGIKREEVIALGDGFNDIPMLEWAGLGIAMENACDRVKAAADEITASNEEDGVALVLEKYFG
jgi:Cof subfamily protein (haloacid dehalogenase superfamily)